MRRWSISCSRCRARVCAGRKIGSTRSPDSSDRGQHLFFRDHCGLESTVACVWDCRATLPRLAAQTVLARPKYCWKPANTLVAEDRVASPEVTTLRALSRWKNVALRGTLMAAVEARTRSLRIGASRFLSRALDRKALGEKQAGSSRSFLSAVGGVKSKVMSIFCVLYGQSTSSVSGDLGGATLNFFFRTDDCGRRGPIEIRLEQGESLGQQNERDGMSSARDPLVKAGLWTPGRRMVVPPGSVGASNCRGMVSIVTEWNRTGNIRSG